MRTRHGPSRIRRRRWSASGKGIAMSVGLLAIALACHGATAVSSPAFAHPPPPASPGTPPTLRWRDSLRSQAGTQIVGAGRRRPAPGGLLLSVAPLFVGDRKERGLTLAGAVVKADDHESPSRRHGKLRRGDRDRNRRAPV